MEYGQRSLNSQHPLAIALAIMRLLQATLKTSRNSLIQSSLIMSAMLLNKDMETLNFLQPQITFTIDMESLLMAKQNKPDFNLIDYRLSDLELDNFEKWQVKEAPTFQGMLVSLAEKDYKVSFTFVENSEAWCISITGKPDAKFNSSSTLTTWSDEPLEALAMAVYKVFIVFDGGVWKAQPKSRRG